MPETTCGAEATGQRVWARGQAGERASAGEKKEEGRRLALACEWAWERGEDWAGRKEGGLRGKEREESFEL